jgi:RNA polymerase sigma-70 factor (ECF subfamily)
MGDPYKFEAGAIMSIGTQSCAATMARINPISAAGPAVSKISSTNLVGGAEESDYVLARAAAGGGMTALGDLFERYHRRVYSVCLRMTHNAAEAEDLTQEVFLHLVKKIGSFRGDSQFNTWLHRLTVNLVLMHFRRGARRREWGTEDPETIVAVAQRNKRPTNLQLTNRIALASAMAHLPRGCRLVFFLYDVAGYKHDEVAGLLGCSVGTSKSQLHRARVKLRELLKSDHQSRTPAMDVPSVPASAFLF